MRYGTYFFYLDVQMEDYVQTGAGNGGMNFIMFGVKCCCYFNYSPLKTYDSNMSLYTLEGIFRENIIDMICTEFSHLYCGMCSLYYCWINYGKI